MRPKTEARHASSRNRHPQPAARNMKQSIIDHLEKLRKIEMNNRQMFKATAYQNVIRQLQAHTDEVRKLEDLDSIAGIGKSIRAKIQELFETGTIQATHVMSEAEKQMRAMDDLVQVMGIGPVKARSLIQEHGIYTLDDLRKHDDLLNDKQRMGVKYHDHFLQRIPRNEMVQHHAVLKKAFKDIDPTLSFEVAGSYRRELASSGDIDVLMTYDPRKTTDPNKVFKSLINALKAQGYLVDDFGFGNKKYMGVTRIGSNPFRRIDIMFTHPSEYPFAVLYFTGSQQFNIAMRNHALTLGYSLNEYGLTDVKTGKRLEHPFKNEKDIFKFLDMVYVEPKDRRQ